MKRLPSALNYWEGWAIVDSSGKCLLVIDSKEINPIKEKDLSKHLEKITKGDIVYILGLIEESPLTYLDDPILKEWLPLWQKRWSLLSHKDPFAKKNLDELHKTLKGDLRGKAKPEALKELIKRDIELFKEIEKRTKEENKKSLEAIFHEIVEQDQYKIDIDRIWKVYKAYKNIHDKCLPALGNFDNFLTFLETCREKIDLPVCFSYHENFIFVKGETRGDNSIKVSF